MNELIKSIKKFTITNNEQEFDDSLDLIINKMSQLQTSEFENEQWDLVKTNYSKLRYLNHILELSKLNLEEHKKFLFSLDRFMEYTDKISQTYLKNINWENETEFIAESKIIHLHFSNSLNQTNVILKMKDVLSAYGVLVPIIESIRNEKFVEIIEDEEFLQEFKRKKYA